MAKKLTLEQTRYKLAKAHWDSVQIWERSQPCKFADCDCCQCRYAYHWECDDDCELDADGECVALSHECTEHCKSCERWDCKYGCQCYVDTCKDCAQCEMVTEADKAKRILTNVPKPYPKPKPVVKVRGVKHHEHTTRLTDDGDEPLTFGKLRPDLQSRIRAFASEWHGAMHEGYADDLPVRIECQHYANNGTFFEVMRTRNGKPAKHNTPGYDGITVKIAELHQEAWQGYVCMVYGTKYPKLEALTTDKERRRKKTHRERMASKPAPKRAKRKPARRKKQAKNPLPPIPAPKVEITPITDDEVAQIQEVVKQSIANIPIDAARMDAETHHATETTPDTIQRTGHAVQWKYNPIAKVVSHTPTHIDIIYANSNLTPVIFNHAFEHGLDTPATSSQHEPHHYALKGA